MGDVCAQSRAWWQREREGSATMHGLVQSDSDGAAADSRFECVRMGLGMIEKRHEASFSTSAKNTSAR